MTALERNTALSQRERDNYYGELEVILSFLAFNSITGMSEHHRRAYKLLSGAPQTLSKQGIWTFGAPVFWGCICARAAVYGRRLRICRSVCRRTIC